MNPQYKLHISKLSTQDLLPYIQNSKHSPLISAIRQFNITGNDLLELREFDVRRKYGNQINQKQFQALLSNVQNSPQDLFPLKGAPPVNPAPVLKKKLPRVAPNQAANKGTNRSQEEHNVTSIKQQFERRGSVKLGSTGAHKALSIHSTFPRHRAAVSTRNESHFTQKKSGRETEITSGEELPEYVNHQTNYQQSVRLEEQSPFAKSIQQAKLTLQRRNNQTPEKNPNKDFSSIPRHQEPVQQQRNIAPSRPSPLDYEPQEYQNLSEVSNQHLEASHMKELQKTKNQNTNVSSLPRHQSVPQKVQHHQRNISPLRPPPLDYDPQEYQNWSEASNQQMHEPSAFIQDITEQHRKLTLQKNKRTPSPRHQESSYKAHHPQGNVSPARPPTLDYEPQEYQNWSEPSQPSHNQESPERSHNNNFSSIPRQHVSSQKAQPHYQRDITPARPPPLNHEPQEYQNWSEESIDTSPGRRQGYLHDNAGSSTLNPEKRRELQQKLNLVIELKKEQEQQQQQQPQPPPENIYTEYDDHEDFEDEDTSKSNESADSFNEPGPVPSFVPPALPRRPPEIFKSVSGIKKIKVKDVPGENIREQIEEAPSSDPRISAPGHHYGKLPMIPPSLPAVEPKPQEIEDDNEYVEPVNLSSPEFILQKLKFFRNCKRDEGKRILSNKPPGTFLIRPSDKYMAVLMFKGRTLYNIPIECDRSKKFYLAPQSNSSDNAIKFPKIDELLNYYCEYSPCGNGDCLLSIDINNLN